MNLFDEGIGLFNTGRYFEAHEVWEDLWRQSDGPAKDHCQGLIHAAVGLYHLQRRNRVGARNQLNKCLARLRRHADDMAGIDNRELARRLGEIVDGLEKPDMGDAWFDRLPAVRIERP